MHDLFPAGPLRRREVWIHEASNCDAHKVRGPVQPPIDGRAAIGTEVPVTIEPAVCASGVDLIRPLAPHIRLQEVSPRVEERSSASLTGPAMTDVVYSGLPHGNGSEQAAVALGGSFHRPLPPCLSIPLCTDFSIAISQIEIAPYRDIQRDPEIKHAQRLAYHRIRLLFAERTLEDEAFIIILDRFYAARGYG